MLFRNLFAMDKSKSAASRGIVISSVVPPLDSTLRQVCETLLQHEAAVHRARREDRNARALRQSRGSRRGPHRELASRPSRNLAGLHFVDFGTATTFDCVSAKGEYHGRRDLPGHRHLRRRAVRTHRAPAARRHPQTRARHRHEHGGQHAVRLYYGYLGLVDGILELLLDEMGRIRRSWRRVGWHSLSERHRSTSSTWTICSRLTGFASYGSEMRCKLRQEIHPAFLNCIDRPSANSRRGRKLRPADSSWKITSITSPKSKSTSSGGAAAFAAIDSGLGADRDLEGCRHSAGGGLRGIDDAFDRYEKRPSKQKVNSLAYCAQEVLAAAEDMKEAAVGMSSGEKPEGGGIPGRRDYSFSSSKCRSDIKREVAAAT